MIEQSGVDTDQSFQVTKNNLEVIGIREGLVLSRSLLFQRLFVQLRDESVACRQTYRAHRDQVFEESSLGGSYFLGNVEPFLAYVAHWLLFLLLL